MVIANLAEPVSFHCFVHKNVGWWLWPPPDPKWAARYTLVTIDRIAVAKDQRVRLSFYSSEQAKWYSTYRLSVYEEGVMYQRLSELYDRIVTIAKE